MALKAELKNEIATVERDITVPVYGGVLRHNDDTLLTRGGGRGLQIYDDIERDCHAYAVLQKRKMAVIAREWTVTSATQSRIDVKAADMVREQLTNLAADVPDDEVLPQVTGFDSVCLNLLDAILKGFAVGEVMWQTDGKEIVASEIRPKNQRRFAFAPGKRGYRLTLKTWENLLPGIPVPPRKFVVHSFGSKDGNPFGLGLGNKLFWPAYFKRQDITFWLTFVDKFASPTGLGKYPAGASPEDQQKLLNALSAIASDAGVIVPEGMMIELLEAARSGSIDSYEKLARYMDEQISECVLGETGTTNQHGSGGSRARDEIGNEIRLELVKADSDLLSGTLNCTLIRWISNLNVPNANPPKVWREVSAPEDLKAKSERDGNLAKNAGVKFSIAYFNREYGLQDGDIESVGVPVPTPTAEPGKAVPAAAVFAEGDNPFPDQAAIDDLLAAIAPEELQGQMEKVLKPLFKLIDESGDLTEVMGDLVRLFPKMDTDQLQDLLARMIFIAEVWGRLNGPD